jgi:transposase
VVEEYLSGKGSFETVSSRFSLDRSMLRRWVAGYQQHGQAGLGRKRTDYDTDFKQQVLQRMSQEGLSVRQVMALFDIRAPGTVTEWVRLYDAGGIAALEPRPRGRPRKMTMSLPDKPIDDKIPDERTREELLKENEYLRAEVAYLKKLDALLQAKRQAAQQKKRK